MRFTKQQSRNQNGARPDEKPVAKTTGATSPAACALLILFLLNTAAVLFAQTTADTGSIVGMVRDSSGGLVVGA